MAVSEYFAMHVQSNIDHSLPIHVLTHKHLHISSFCFIVAMNVYVRILLTLQSIVMAVNCILGNSRTVLLDQSVWCKIGFPTHSTIVSDYMFFPFP